MLATALAILRLVTYIKLEKEIPWKATEILQLIKQAIFNACRQTEQDKLK
jgi:hypothetical protein